MKSMSGFVSNIYENDNFLVQVEIKSINSRYLESRVYLSSDYRFLEQALLKSVREHLIRGKVDLRCEITSKDPNAFALEPNYELLDAYDQVYKEIIGKYEIPGPRLSDYLKDRDSILARKNVDEELVLSSVIPFVNESLLELTKMREVEGMNLRDQIVKSLGDIEVYTKEIEALVDQPLEILREKYQQTIEQILSSTELDRNRLYTELAILIEKGDISEEITRIDSHLKQFDTMLDQEAMGKSMDFLAQELLRETNTIASKSKNAKITALVVKMKNEIEKIREQLGNVE